MITTLLVLMTSFSAWAEAAADQNVANRKPSLFNDAANPAMSLNVLGLIQASDDGNQADAVSGNGVSLQEVELRMTANVDPYWRLDGTLSIRDEGQGYQIEPEEVFIESLLIPGTTLRAGKYFSFFGKHNSMHTHIFPFIDAPLANTMILGDEGLNEVGVAAAFLVALPWYFEITFQALDGGNEDLYNSPTASHVLAGLNFNNLWELSSSTTLEWILSYFNGKNSALGSTRLYATALTLKSPKFVLSSELILKNSSGLNSADKIAGLSTWIQYQFVKSWWIQGRHENLGGIQHSDGLEINRYSGLLGFSPSHFSMLRLQYSATQQKGSAGTDHAGALQWNMTIGAHPAHDY